MTRDPEANFVRDYRDARKAFIKACEIAHVDSIARVHPGASGADGKPLFIDSAALGPRDARKAVLVIADGAGASTALTALLAGLSLPKKTRLVLVHAFDPFSFAGAEGQDRQWSLAMLRAIAREDLAQVTDLTVLMLGAADEDLAEVLRLERPGSRVALKQMGRENRHESAAQSGGCRALRAVKNKFLQIRHGALARPHKQAETS